MKFLSDRQFRDTLRSAYADDAVSALDNSGNPGRTGFVAASICSAAAALIVHNFLTVFLSVDTIVSALVTLAATGTLALLYGRMAQVGTEQNDKADTSDLPGEVGLMTALLDAMPAAIVIKNTSGRFIGVNEVFQEWFGFPDAAACLGRTTHDLFPKEMSDTIRAQDREAMERGGVLEHELSYRRPDGSIHQILSRRFLIRGGNSQIVAIAVINIDITDFVRAREEIADLLRQREEQAAIFRGFFDEFPFPAGLRKPDGEVILANPISSVWLGVPQDELVGKKAEDFLPPHLAVRSKALDLSVAETKVTDTYEAQMHCGDGKIRDLLVTRFPLLSDDGELLGLGAFNIDMTEQRTVERLLRDMNSELEALVEERTKELQSANAELTQALEDIQETTQKLIDAEKLASLAPMVAGVAHEINTPIGTGVTASSNIRDKVVMLREQVSSGQLTRRSLEDAVSNIDESSTILLKNLQRANELIRSFKQVSADQSGPSDRRFGLREHLEHVLLTLAPRLRRNGITVDLDCAADLELESDPGAMAQVVTNLLMNAIEHAYFGASSGAVTIDVTQTADRTSIKVRDYGQGIEPEHMKDIFVPFFTTRRGSGGTGLGLAIVYNTVTGNLQGEITCDSTVGEGTVFTIDLPNRLHGPSEELSATPQ